MLERQSLQQMVLESRTDIHGEKSEIRSFFNIIHKNNLRMD